jgi:glycosyltransferase involved in cell wall biosynthesis
MSVSVIIPTYNRYNNLLNCIESIKNQTLKPYEIIVVNDGSTDPRYKTFKKYNNVIFINTIGSKNKLGYPCGALARNYGLKTAQGDYIAFCDDDDVWMPEKLEKQMKLMKENNILMSCTDGYIGNGFFKNHYNYKKYNSEYYNEVLKQKLGIDINEEFPDIINKDILEKHNLIITSSIIFNKKLVDKVGYLKLIKNGGEIINGIKEWQDYEYWKRMLNFTNCLYIKFPLFYYDLNKY